MSTAKAPATPFVLFLSGPDKTGVVSSLTKTVSDFGGNVEASRMTQLGGDFSLIALMQLEEAKLAPMKSELTSRLPDFIINTRKTEAKKVEAESLTAGMKSFELSLEGPDSVGIIAATTEAMARSGVSIIEMSTDLSNAPFAGFPLFSLQATFKTDQNSLKLIQDKSKAIEERFGLTITITEN